MNLTYTNKGDHILIAVRMRRIDAANAMIFKDKLRGMIMLVGKPAIVDMRQVNFVDSSGLGALIAVQKAVTPNPGLRLCHLTPEVERVFRITGKEGVFGVC